MLVRIHIPAYACCCRLELVKGTDRKNEMAFTDSIDSVPSRGSPLASICSELPVRQL